MLLFFIVSIIDTLNKKNMMIIFLFWKEKIFCQQIITFLLYFFVESGPVKVFFSENHLWFIVSRVATDIRHLSKIRFHSPDIRFICRISGKISFWCHNFNRTLHKLCSHAVSYHLVSGSFDEYKWTWHVRTTDLIVSCVPLATIPVYRENPDPVAPAGPTHILSQI